MTYASGTRADLVQLIVDRTAVTVDFCGIAYHMAAVSHGFRDRAFGVNQYSCSSKYILAHEMGHNMGLNHDRYVHTPEARPECKNERNPDGSNTCPTPSNRPFSYSYGYVNDGATPETRFRTIMAYGNRCPRCGPVRRFSNPDAFYNGARTGVHGTRASSSKDGPADARRSLNNTARVVANFMPRIAPDAEVVSVHAEGRVFRPGSRFTLSALIGNLGTGPVDGSVHYWYQPAGGEWTRIAREEFQGLKTEHRTQVDVLLDVPNSHGVHIYTACVSVANDSHSENNCWSQSWVMSVAPPAQVVASLSINGPVLRVGQAFRLLVNLENTGGATSTAGHVPLWFWNGDWDTQEVFPGRSSTSCRGHAHRLDQSDGTSDPRPVRLQPLFLRLRVRVGHCGLLGPGSGSGGGQRRRFGTRGGLYDVGHCSQPGSGPRPGGPAIVLSFRL